MHTGAQQSVVWLNCTSVNSTEEPRQHWQAFEAELKKYMAVEQAVAAVPSAQVLGPLTLETLPLKSSLKSEAASWKAQFARNLHKQGADDLKACPRSVLRACHADGGCAAMYICSSVSHSSQSMGSLTLIHIAHTQGFCLIPNSHVIIVTVTNGRLVAAGL